MSLDLARKVHAKYPNLLLTNTGESCHWFTKHLIEELTAAGFRAFLMCKTANESQYTPLGFQPRIVQGLDGKDYPCTGVSHDAIWCEGRQFDTIGGAHDGSEPFGQPAQPRWEAIPEQYWRPQNPPLKGEPVIIPPPFPSYEAIGGDALFRTSVGIPLEADMATAGQALNNGSSVWFSRTCYSILKAKVADPAADVAPIIKKHRNEWRAALGLPPL